MPVGRNSWRAQAVALSADDAAVGVKSEFKQDGPRLRATLISPTSRDVRWQVKFEPARIDL